MKFTVLLTRESNPDGYLATVPILGLVTEGDTEAEALAAAREAITLELRGRRYDREPIPVEDEGFASLHDVVVDDVGQNAIAPIPSAVQ